MVSGLSFLVDDRGQGRYCRDHYAAPRPSALDSCGKVAPVMSLDFTPLRGVMHHGQVRKREGSTAVFNITHQHK